MDQPNKPIPIERLDRSTLSECDKKAYDRTKKASGICPDGYVPAIIPGEFSHSKGPKKTIKDTCTKCGKKRINRMGPCNYCEQRSVVVKDMPSVIGNNSNITNVNKIKPSLFVGKNPKRTKSINELYGTRQSPTLRTTEIQKNVTLRYRIFDPSVSVDYDSEDDFETKKKKDM